MYKTVLDWPRSARRSSHSRMKERQNNQTYFGLLMYV